MTFGTENHTMYPGVDEMPPVELTETDEAPSATAPDYDDDDDFTDDEDGQVIRGDDEGDA